MLNILISAYACNPYLGSESQVGWNFTSRMSKKHKITVLTSSKNKKDINSFFKRNPKNPKLKFIFIKHNRFSLMEKFWPPSLYWTYAIWQKKAFKIVEQLNKKEKIDLCHQLNMVGFREPGYLWQLNIPFIWGPIGGLTFYSSKLIFHLGIYNFFYSLIYNFLRYLDIKFLIRPKLAFKKADQFIFAANSDTQKNIMKYFGLKSKILLPVGSEDHKIARFKKKTDVFNIFWGGQHVPRKALDLALDALSLLPNDLKWKLHITGKGKLTNKWKQYAIKKEIMKNCIFYGFLEKIDQIYKIMKNCDVHLFTSVKEDTPAIIMETTSFGIPTICFDLFVAKDLVTNKSGIKIPINTSYKENVINLKKAIIRIAVDSKYKKKLSKGTKKLSKIMTWDRNISILNNSYLKLVSNKN